MMKEADFNPETVKVYWKLEKDFKLRKFFAFRYLFPIDETTALGYDPYGFVNDVPTRLDAVLIIKVKDGKLAYFEPDTAERNDLLDMIGAIDKENETPEEKIERLETEVRNLRREKATWRKATSAS